MAQYVIPPCHYGDVWMQGTKRFRQSDRRTVPRKTGAFPRPTTFCFGGHVPWRIEAAGVDRQSSREALTDPPDSVTTSESYTPSCPRAIPLADGPLGYHRRDPALLVWPGYYQGETGTII